LTYGGVPPLLTVGDDAMTAWDKFDATHSRLQALKARPPDFVINAEGERETKRFRSESIL
jgi:hypothetical protein